MSLGQVAQSAPQSAPQTQPSQEAQPSAAETQSQPASTPETAATPGNSQPSSTPAPSQPAADQRGIGDNGGPDWRAMLAGDDVKALERLSRYKAPTDVAKALLEAQTKLSQRGEVPKLPDNATPEQVTEYRKAMGVPLEGTLEAYGIKAPDGYQMPEPEKAALSEFAQIMHAKHAPASVVKEATDYFFRQQTAAAQAQTKVDMDRQKEWQGQLRDKYGREFEPMLAAGEAFLNQHFNDNPEAKQDLLNARLPNGGRLGDHPGFIDLIVDLGVKSGFTDRIEAAALESGGKSLEQQQRELEALRRTDPKLYNEPSTQAKLDKVIALRLSKGEIDESGNPVRKRRTG